jgi:16S rRNA (uracil1498-N3)-methyltransferase
MRLTRVHVPTVLAEGSTVLLGAGPSGHLLRVLRLARGASLTVFDGSGREHGAKIAETREGRAELMIGAAIEPAHESPLSITLAQGVSRGDRMDYALQKATELGVMAVQPLICERSVVKLDPEQAARKREHWQGVVISAAEQSGRARVPPVAAVRRYADHLAAAIDPAFAPYRLVLAPNADIGLNELPAGLSHIELLIGPEGGLSDTELRLATQHGYQGLRLGPRILRTETAAAAAIAALQTLHGDLA